MLPRFEKARAIVKHNLHKIMARDAKGLVRHVLVPGTEGKQYNVHLTRTGNTIKATCELITGYNTLPCRGNHRGLCTHALTALVAAAETQTRTLAFCTTPTKAKRLSNLHHGSISMAYTPTSSLPLYLVTWSKNA